MKAELKSILNINVHTRFGQTIMPHFKICCLAPADSSLGSHQRHPTAGTTGQAGEEWMLGPAQAALAIIRNHARGLTPQELRPFFRTEKTVRVEDLLKALVDARMVRVANGGKHILV